MQSLNPGLSDRPDRLSRFQLKHLYVAIRSERRQSLTQRILWRSTQKTAEEEKPNRTTETSKEIEDRQETITRKWPREMETIQTTAL